MHTIRASNLVKIYRGRRVVDGVSLTVSAGEVVGLLGPNGAGKTTTFYMCVGLAAPEQGTITLDDADITKSPMFERARRGIGYLPQEPSIFRKLSVRDNVMAILETIPFESNEAREDRMQQLLASSLSGGERRRVEIARALASNPKFILLDEPFAGIDPIAIKDIQEIVETLRDKQIGILITDHNVRETLGICDRAYIMVDGKVLEEGAPTAIAASDKARRYYLGDHFAL
jgi:lipopolysaccharide export system ATP-binding protein